MIYFNKKWFHRWYCGDKSIHMRHIWTFWRAGNPENYYCKGNKY